MIHVTARRSSRVNQWIYISLNNSVFKMSSNTCRVILVSRSADKEIFKPVHVFWRRVYGSSTHVFFYYFLNV